MQEISAKIVEQKIISSNISISLDLSQKFEISMACKAKVMPPRSEEEKSILLNVVFNVGTKDEKLKMELVADLIFELEQIPDDYNEIAEKKLIPMASEALLDSLDEILVIMGYRKMELAKKYMGSVC